jgi:hypothetical protein
MIVAAVVAHADEDGLSALAFVVLVGATALALAVGELRRRTRAWWASRAVGREDDYSSVKPKVVSGSKCRRLRVTRGSPFAAADAAIHRSLSAMGWPADSVLARR